MRILTCLFVSIFAVFSSVNAHESSFRDAYGSTVMMVNGDILVAETSGFSRSGVIHVLRENERGSWEVVQTFASSDASIGDGFGSQMAYSSDFLAVSSPGAMDGEGAVYVFKSNASGDWGQVARLIGDGGLGGQFGASIAFAGTMIAVGEPGVNGKVGQVSLFSSETNWSRAGTIVPPLPEAGATFGSSVAAEKNVLAVGSPGFDSSKGRIDLFDLDQSNRVLGAIESADGDENRLGSSVIVKGGMVFAANPRALRSAGQVSIYSRKGGKWVLNHQLSPEGSGSGPMFFGTSIAFTGEEIWISAPLANEFGGAVYRYDDSSFSLLSTIENELEGGRTQFGASLSIAGGVAVIGMPGNDYGLGSAVIYRLGEQGDWQPSVTYNRPVADLPPIAGAEIECENGVANGYGCENVDLVSFVPLKDLKMNRGVRLNDVWGWTDEENGKEYGIIGHMEAAVFIDVSDPLNPIVLGELPRTKGSPGSTWRDMKVFKDHAFIVADGAGQHGMQIFDLHRLRDWSGTFEIYEPDVLYTNIASAHNIVINEGTGFAYTVGNSSGGETCGGALHMIDINEPQNPKFVGCFNDPATGGGGSGATHDAQCVTYSGPDSEHTGKEICVGSNGTAISVADVTDKNNPVAISQGTYPNSAYVHQGWFTEDHKYFYQNDEGDETGGLTDRTRTMIWDLTDLDEPEMIAEYFGDSNSTDHNLYVKGDYMYQTNNASGLRVIDIRDRANPVEVGFFDTTPNGKNVAGFDGTWSSYPYFKSGAILVTSRREGLFIVRKKQVDI